MLFDYLPPGPIVLDASAIINLLGCGEMERVLQTLEATCIVEERTLNEVQRHPVPGNDHISVIDNLRQCGRLQVDRMSDDEYDIYLALAQGSLTSRLDIGESAAIALASRGYPVVVDENKARSVLTRRFPEVRFCSTLRLLLSAGKRGLWTVEYVQGLVFAACRHARMGVPRDERGDLDRLMDGHSGWPIN